MIRTRFRLHHTLTIAALLATATPAIAGPPLLCHQFDIGTARSLPWDGTSGWTGRAALAPKTLVADIEALLTPTTPILVRMETLRRAAIYASRDAQVATQLLQRFQARAASSIAMKGAATKAAPTKDATTKSASMKAPSTKDVSTKDVSTNGVDPLASFDAGYLIETYREIGRTARWEKFDRYAEPATLSAVGALVADLDGYAMVRRSLTARSGDPAIELAAALIAASTDRHDLYTQHVQRAKAGAGKDALLARNITQITGTN